MKIDFTFAMDEIVKGHGIKAKDIYENSLLLFALKENIRKLESKDYFPLQLPEVMLKEVQEINSYAKKIRDQYDNLVVVGMGGSILGNELLHYALKGIYGNNFQEKKVYFIDNIDPETTISLLESIDLKRTFFNFITKSGSTSETLLNMLLISKFLEKVKGNIFEQSLFITDPEKGLLRKIANSMHVKAYPIHPDVGGRYSVLSHVGLFSAAFEGINIEKLLLGALKRRKHFIESEPLKESALILPFVQYTLFKELGININVLFSYSDGLEYLGKWYEQLLAESIGKKYSRNGELVNVGITPMVQKGPYHQHSTLQLFMEGPYDKLIIFVNVENFRKDLIIKDADGLNFKETEFLLGKPYSKLLHSEYEATRIALTQNGRPNISIEIESINEETLGELIYFFELSVLALGELFKINPIDQPSVEIGKKFTHALMGDEAYKEHLSALEKMEKLDKLILD